MNDTRKWVFENLKTKVNVKADNIEKSIYNFAIHYCTKRDIVCDWDNNIFNHVYKQKSVDVFKLLEDEDIVAKILTKEINSKDVAYLLYNDIYTTKELNHESTEEVSEGIFHCRKCGSNKTTYYSLQTRSADEPMTNFITCVVCKNRWKM